MWPRRPASAYTAAPCWRAPSAPLPRCTPGRPCPRWLGGPRCSARCCSRTTSSSSPSSITTSASSCPVVLVSASPSMKTSWPTTPANNEPQKENPNAVSGGNDRQAAPFHAGRAGRRDQGHREGLRPGAAALRQVAPPVARGRQLRQRQHLRRRGQRRAAGDHLQPAALPLHGDQRQAAVPASVLDSRRRLLTDS